MAEAAVFLMEKVSFPEVCQANVLYLRTKQNRE
jgi:hypothetical protein